MAVGSLVGKPWDTLFCSENTLPTRSSVEPSQEMAVFGRCPETDPVLIIVCKICGKLVLAPAMSRHLERHESPALDLNNLIGSSWDKLFTDETNELPIDVTQNNYSNIDSQPLKDVIVLGNVPEKDAFSTIQCALCNKRVMCAAIPNHLLKHDANIVNLKAKMVAKQNASLLEKQNSCDSLKSRSTSNVRRKDTESIVKPLLVPPLKVKIVKKVSPPKKTLILDDDVNRKNSKKKCRSPVPPLLQPVLPACKRVILLNEPPELSPALPKKVIKSVERKPEKVYDPDKNCGVINDLGKPCLRSILCKAHLVSQKRAVLNRSLPYDTIIKHNKSLAEDVIKLQCTIPPPVTVIPMAEVFKESACIELIEPLRKRPKTDETDVFEQLHNDLKWKENAPKIEASPPPLVMEAHVLRWDNNALIQNVSPTPFLIGQTNTRRHILRWDENAPVQAAAPPRQFSQDHPQLPSNPRPLATNTFGCRLVGGLMTKCKKLDAFRKHVQSVWGTSEIGTKRKRADSVDDFPPPSQNTQTNGVSRSLLPSVGVSLLSAPSSHSVLSTASPNGISRSVISTASPNGGISRSVLSTASPNGVLRSVLSNASPSGVSRSVLSTASPSGVSRSLLSPASPNVVSHSMMTPPSPINFIQLNEYNLVL